MSFSHDEMRECFGRTTYSVDCFFFFYSYIVPSRGPRIIDVSANTPESVFVKWEAIPRQHVNGILQGYYVNYSAQDARFPVIKKVVTVNSTVTHVMLEQMKPSTRYKVWIAGFTRKGAGPSTEKEFVSTLPAGTLQTSVVYTFV